jgi:hypothetical protein
MEISIEPNLYLIAGHMDGCEVAVKVVEAGGLEAAEAVFRSAMHDDDNLGLDCYIDSSCLLNQALEQRLKPTADISFSNQENERNYTDLEKVLILHGFTEMFGIGLFAVSEVSVLADTNSGMVKLQPNIDAPSDDFIGFYREDNIDELKERLEALKKVDYNINSIGS